jgi:hypothetical protein
MLAGNMIVLVPYLWVTQGSQRAWAGSEAPLPGKCSNVHRGPCPAWGAVAELKARILKKGAYLRVVAEASRR